MSIIVKAKCLKNVYKNGDYRIFSWSPIEKDKELKLSNYFTFSTKGNDSYIQEQKRRNQKTGCLQCTFRMDYEHRRKGNQYFRYGQRSLYNRRGTDGA